MQWSEVRKAYPDQWLIIEALQAHTTPDGRRILDKLAIIERCSDGKAAWRVIAVFTSYTRPANSTLSTPAEKNSTFMSGNG